MEKNNNENLSNTQDYFTNSINEFILFVNQVVYDKMFIEKLNKLLPFDKMANAIKHLSIENNILKKIGISVLRMDVEPALYSLAVTMTITKDDGVQHECFIFIAACKTIDELQFFVQDEQFKEKILMLCKERVSGVFNS